MSISAKLHLKFLEFFDYATTTTSSVYNGFWNLKTTTPKTDLCFIFAGKHQLSIACMSQTAPHDTWDDHCRFRSWKAHSTDRITHRSLSIYIYIYIIRNHTSVKSPLLWAILIHYYYFALIFTWKLLLLVPGRLQKSPALALKLALVEECPNWLSLSFDTMIPWIWIGNVSYGRNIYPACWCNSKFYITCDDLTSILSLDLEWAGLMQSLNYIPDTFTRNFCGSKGEVSSSKEKQ